MTKSILAWHLADEDNRMYVTTPDGKKVSMPRYYKNKIYTEEQRVRIGEITRIKMLEREKMRNLKKDKTYYHNKQESIYAMNKKIINKNY